MMKQMKFTTLLLLLGAFFLVQPAFAMIETHNTVSTAAIEKQKNDLKKEFKAEKINEGKHPTRDICPKLSPALEKEFEEWKLKRARK